MSKIILIVIVIFSISQSWASENLKCNYGKGQFTDALTLEIESEKVLGLKYFSTAAAYSCDVSARRDDEDTNWTNQGKITTIKFDKGTAVIQQRGNTYTVRFVNLSHIYHCGMNGQLPEQIILSRGSNKCKIK